MRALHPYSLGGGGTPRLRPVPGSDDAFSAVLLQHLPQLRRTAAMLMGDPDLAADLTQDCVERALKHRAALTDLRNAGAWLRAILHNLCIDELRRRRSRGRAVDLDDLSNALALSAPPADTDAVADFLRAAGALAADQQEILRLAGVEGLSYREIAARLHVPSGTVMSRLSRARAELRVRLAQRKRAH